MVLHIVFGSTQDAISIFLSNPPSSRNYSSKNMQKIE